MRRKAILMVSVLGCAGFLTACSEDKAMKGHSEPQTAIARAELWVTRLQEMMAKPDYSPDREPTFGRVTTIVTAELPYALSESKLKDAALREQVAPKLAELQQTFQQHVSEPIWQQPPELDNARAGLDECLGVVRQIGQILGG
jgi:hypothetical protein